MENKEIDLFELDILKKEESDNENLQKEEDIINKAVENINSSVAAIHVGMHTLATRIHTLEMMVSFLLEKDPEMGPKLRAQAEKLAFESSTATNNE